MSSAAAIPGLYFSARGRPPEPSPLRSDVAGFVGRARRGPVSRAVRVEGWRGFLREFGGLNMEMETPYAVRGYFENGGQVAYVLRCGTPEEENEAARSQSLRYASGMWTIGTRDAVTGQLNSEWPGRGAFRALAYRVYASSPGSWAADTVVSLRYWADGLSGRPTLEVMVQARDEPREVLTGLFPAPQDPQNDDPEHSLEAQVARSSTLIRLLPAPLPVGVNAAALRPPAAPEGPRYREWTVRLQGGQAEPVTPAAYLDAVRALGDLPEVALVALPDLHADVIQEEERREILALLLQQAEELHDRLVLVDVPRESSEASAAVNWVRGLYRQGGPLEGDERLLRGAAVYHPRLRVRDQLGGAASPPRCVPSCGHVAGVISRLDRERGAHHTPANADLLDAVDLSGPLDDEEQATLYEQRINLLRCKPGRGLQVWGGRTLSDEPTGQFVAHRRLIHRLVRAIRRVAEPLVFESNGPEMWLTLVRAITTLLLEAYRAGALKGARPEEAFRVRCDETTNPPEAIEQGRVLCEIEVAPAVPMEFILLRVGVSGEGRLEVFES